MFTRLLVTLLSLTALFGAELPVRKVALFKHGVGYFERSGPLAPGEAARLDFKASEMDDVLKSLTVSGAGTVSGLRYDAAIPLNQRLSEFPFQLLSGQPLTALLDQLKGAAVEITSSGKTVTGAIIGARTVPGDKDHAERQQVSLLYDFGAIGTVELAQTEAIRFPDAVLQRQFRDYLGALLASRSTEKRSLYVDAAGGAARQVVVRYITPAPMWKSSYRLIFPETGEPTLEGWAMVDNTTGEAWNQVNLSLVSGKPISFIFPLYAPRQVARNTAALPEEQAAAPELHSGGMAGGVFGGIGGGRGAAKYKSELRQMPAAGLMSANSALDSVAEMSSIETAAASEIADLFEYRMPHPVTIPKDQSAMLPFLQQKIAARKLEIYSDQSSEHPRNAAELTNTTGKTLDGGPVTLFDGGAYAGEALVETIKGGDKRLISYAVDLGTRITRKIDARNATVREIHMNRGILTTRYSQVQTRTYNIRNADDKAKTLIIEQPIRQEWTVTSRKPTDTSATNYRFEVALEPQAAVSFPVTEEHLYSTSTGVSSFTPDVLVTYIENQALNDAARKQLQQIVDLKRQIAAAESDRANLNARVSALETDQQRLRQTMMSLNSVNGQQEQVQKYARDLAAREEQITALRTQQDTSRQKQSRMQAELDALIGRMQF